MTKRQISLIIIGIIILTFVGRSIWKRIDTGTLTIIEPAPFAFMFDASDMMNCASGKCALSLASGNHDVLITKEGYANFLAEITIERGKSIELKPVLQRVLSVESQPKASFTLPKNANPFTLREDKVGRIALVKKTGTSNEETIVYFARPFTSPFIVSDKLSRFAWIADKRLSSDRIADGTSETSIYRVNVKEKSRKAIFATEEPVLGMIPSPSGSSLLIILENGVRVVTNDGALTAKMSTAGLTEKTIIWGGESTLFLVQHSGVEDSLSRAQLDDGSGSIQVKKMDQIGKWDSEDDTIEFIYLEEKLQELHVQGKKKAYVVKL